MTSTGPSGLVSTVEAGCTASHFSHVVSVISPRGPTNAQRRKRQVHGQTVTMFSQNSKQRDRNAAENGEASQPLLNGSHEDLTPDAEDHSHLLFSATDDDDSESHSSGRSVTPRRGEHTVRFREEVQVIGPPLRSTIHSRETGTCS